MKEGDEIYTGNYHHILYFLLRRESPTPYIHRSLLWTEEHRKALKIDTESAIRKIFDVKPAFVVVQDTIYDTSFNQNLNKHYVRTVAIKTESGIPVYLYQRSRIR